MIQITDSLFINENEIEFNFIRASGPGGQNVNKVNSAAQLRFHVENSSLPDHLKEKLMIIAKNKISNTGILVIDARKYRSQERNREDAIFRLVELIKKCLIVIKKRRKTKPSRGSVVKRLDNKKQKGNLKKSRNKKIDY
jgi:ribosome-associated protein